MESSFFPLPDLEEDAKPKDPQKAEEKESNQQNTNCLGKASIQTEVPPPKLKCHHCNKVFTRMFYLNVHLQAAHNERCMSNDDSMSEDEDAEIEETLSTHDEQQLSANSSPIQDFRGSDEIEQSLMEFSNKEAFPPLHDDQQPSTQEFTFFKHAKEFINEVPNAEVPSPTQTEQRLSEYSSPNPQELEESFEEWFNGKASLLQLEESFDEQQTSTIYGNKGDQSSDQQFPEMKMFEDLFPSSENENFENAAESNCQEEKNEDVMSRVNQQQNQLDENNNMMCSNRDNLIPSLRTAIKQSVAESSNYSRRMTDDLSMLSHDAIDENNNPMCSNHESLISSPRAAIKDSKSVVESNYSRGMNDDLPMFDQDAVDGNNNMMCFNHDNSIPSPRAAIKLS